MTCPLFINSLWIPSFVAFYFYLQRGFFTLLILVLRLFCLPYCSFWSAETFGSNERDSISVTKVNGWKTLWRWRRGIFFSKWGGKDPLVSLFSSSPLLHLSRVELTVIKTSSITELTASSGDPGPCEKPWGISVTALRREGEKVGRGWREKRKMKERMEERRGDSSWELVFSPSLWGGKRRLVDWREMKRQGIIRKSSRSLTLCFIPSSHDPEFVKSCFVDYERLFHVIVLKVPRIQQINSFHNYMLFPRTLHVIFYTTVMQ